MILNSVISPLNINSVFSTKTAPEPVYTMATRCIFKHLSVHHAWPGNRCGVRGRLCADIKICVLRNSTARASHMQYRFCRTIEND